MTMLHKSFEIIDTKADAETGTFEATVAVFGNVDKGGDRIMPGAFDNTLAKWRASGDPIPVILSHSWNDPFHHVGVADPHDVTATTKGLHVKGKLDIADNDVAKQVHRLMARRSLKEFSFGYSVPKGGEKRAKDGANDLTEIDLAEVGPTLKGMNPATELHAVKSALGVAPPSAEELREATKRVEREMEIVRVPEVAATVATAPTVDYVAELAEVKAALTETRRLLAEATEPAPLDSKAVDREARRTAREVEGIQVPEVPESKGKRLASDIRGVLDAAGTVRYGDGPDKWSYLDDYDPDGKWAVFSVDDSIGRRYLQVPYTLNSDGTVELGSTQTEVVRATSYRPVNGGKSFTASTELRDLWLQLEDLKKKADETDKEPKARSVDPLRKQADAVALEIASDGQSLRKPPKTVAPEPQPLIPLDELKKRMRDEMLGVLSGGITE